MHFANVFDVQTLKMFFSRSLEVKKHVVVSAGCGHHCNYKSKTIFLQFPEFALLEWRARISHTWPSDGSGCFGRWPQQSGNCSSHETSLDNSHFLMVVLVSGKPWTHVYFLTSWCNCLFFVIYTNAISLWNADKKKVRREFFSPFYQLCDRANKNSASKRKDINYIDANTFTRS